MAYLHEMPRVNCGCWTHPLPGYVNIDMSPAAVDCEHGDQILLHDVRDGLQFADGSVAEVRGDQFLEHLSLPEIVAFLAECARVLCVGGEVRFEFPDMIACAGGSIDARCVAEQGRGIEGVPDDLTMLNLLTHEWGHQCILSLELVLPLFERHFAVRHAARFGANALVIGVKR